MKRRKPPAIDGTTHASIQILARLHATMKRIRHARHKAEGIDPKLCRIYSEAVEQYINAKPQQELLKRFPDGEVKAVNRMPDTGTWIC